MKNSREQLRDTQARIELYRQHADSNLTGSPDAWVEEQMRFRAAVSAPLPRTSRALSNALPERVAAVAHQLYQERLADDPELTPEQFDQDLLDWGRDNPEGLLMEVNERDPGLVRGSLDLAA